jgi:predicted ribosome quality control (RQC) complex YloA/Tae2 family protein
MNVPFDSVCLAAVVAEARAYAGGRLQDVRQPTESDVYLGVYAAGKEAMLLLNCHPVYFRAHFSTRRPKNAPEPPALCAALRSRCLGGTVVAISQRGLDRVVDIHIESDKGRHVLVAELMGKHSNLMLVGPDGKVLAAAKSVGRSKSVRPVHSGVTYRPPPFAPRPSFLSAGPEDDVAQFEGVSPFLRRYVAVAGLDTVQACVREERYEGWISPGSGAYPLPLHVLGLPEFQRPSLSLALEQHYDEAQRSAGIESLRQSLTTSLERAILAREVAIRDLQGALDAGGRAPQLQLYGELILAYASTVQPGSGQLSAWDYEGRPIEVPLNPEIDAKANAQAYFDRAKRAKGRMGAVREQLDRQQSDLVAIEAALQRVQEAARLDDLENEHRHALGRRWLSIPSAPAKKEDRPYEGHRVRELVAPHGWTVLYGENAEANDYLTLRVAKPNDWWLHVRGGTSAHVVIPTRNHPEKVNPEALKFAAEVAVRNSPQKHSGFVPVDYTLKKYVRKPRGAARGAALYTHEKTLHVDSRL